MLPGKSSFRLPFAIVTFVILSLLLTIAVHRIRLDFDVTSSLPSDDPVIASARYMLKHHPLQDQVIIDVGLATADPDLLVEAGEIVMQELRQSGLFKRIGLGDLRHEFPALMQVLLDNLPLLFTRSELQKRVRPLLAKHRVRSKLVSSLNQLSGLGGVGRGEMITRDPLGLSSLVLEKMSHLSFAEGIRIYRGHLLSADNQHLLILASPAKPGTDTANSRSLTRLLDRLAVLMSQRYHEQDKKVVLTSVGTYRAALDNEMTAKADTRRVILFSIVGITLLLVFSFPRPGIGLLALVPALAGTVIAFFLFSVFYSSISILTLGFGGAVISITVDHAIAYFLFLDRPHQTSGRNAARETRAVCLLAILTTVGAFLTLSISGFPLLSEIGQFAAMGIGASFIFLHTIFPQLIPGLSPAKKKQPPLLQRSVNRLGRASNGTWVSAAFVFGVIMLFYARPQFNADLESINTISPETAVAEKQISRVWGNVFSRVYMALESETLPEMQQKSDRLLNLLEADRNSGQLDSVFVSSIIFPGKGRANSNFSDWRDFWTRRRIQDLKKEIKAASSELGFTAIAFEPFFRQLYRRQMPASALPERFSEMMGITRTAQGKWIQFLKLKPGKNYSAEVLYHTYQQEDSVTLFDAGYFSSQLGSLLLSTFLKMVVIISLSVVCLIFLFFLSWKLTLIAILPVVFAMVSTLGTLNILDHPLDIAGLMLSIIVIGMGVDYSLFLVLSYQRYGDEDHPSLGLIRMAVFLASVSTLIGFGALTFADHKLLKSAGLVSVLGIGYALIGAFVILPPLLRKLFITDRQRMMKKGSLSDNRSKRVLSRFMFLEAYPRMFARFKILLDPMFPELDRYVDFSGKILDIGCGYGVPACWILDRFPGARIFGVDPDPERVRIAGKVISDKGAAAAGSATDLPFAEQEVDLVLLLDMIHYLDDGQLRETLQAVHARMGQPGKIVIRVTIPNQERTPVWRRVETIRLRIRRQAVYFRSETELRTLIEGCGFNIEALDPSGIQREETWIMAVTGEIPAVISEQVGS
ncbi:MAG: methyltransferase domain-containing protein [Deltaproteobacteria bacterium]|nr:methyltransferase domain-containing protein [Deltaproteobacteria bacterium]MBT6504345.1 methyltransferase domain-containing protein [Deltaproteobacteria bacterium]MBT7716420.1 methyltransferase domain-containing protein [Deltaproteobacteria bacterium]